MLEGEEDKIASTVMASLGDTRVLSIEMALTKCLLLALPIPENAMKVAQQW